MGIVSFVASQQGCVNLKVFSGHSYEGGLLAESRGMEVCNTKVADHKVYGRTGRNISENQTACTS